MAYKMSILENRIQTCRENLHNLLYCHSLTDDIVVDCSRKLDKLLVEYEKI
ncbi:aspartyl-phosphate phosphatase Spo0E family protein [Clostridium botulinum]|uniref:aspartyl-phosphate phosphatase Spo0E family protein n=1 Tax=Clostridium botulinum TaxID=1491 RepID=UPI002F2B39CB